MFDFGPLCKILVISSLIFGVRFPSSQAMLQIELLSDIISWTESYLDCILRKRMIPANESDACYRCSMNPNLGIPLNVPGWNQKYINCSDFCEYITVCTEAKYYTVTENRKEPLHIPVCYQCENRKSEDVYFQLIRGDELCSKQCTQCAAMHDIRSASECAKQCTGLPTFCYPIERWFNHRKCYQATFWYGCVYETPPEDKQPSTSCQECAKEALNLKDAQECAVECDGLPTYISKSSNNVSAIVQCVEPPESTDADFFYYDIPQGIANYMHVSNPGNIYPSGSLAQFYLSSFVGKKIFRKFNMSLLTWPRPPGYEEILY